MSVVEATHIQAMHQMRRLANVIDSACRGIAYMRAMAEEGESTRDAPLSLVFHIEGLYEDIEATREATQMFVRKALGDMHLRYDQDALDRAYASPYGQYVSDFMKESKE